MLSALRTGGAFDGSSLRSAVTGDQTMNFDCGSGLGRAAICGEIPRPVGRGAVEEEYLLQPFHVATVEKCGELQPSV